MNYTKGEWKANRHGVFVECRNLIIANIVNRETNDETIGNARLISAAPDMYEALKQYERIGIFKEYPNYLEGLRNILAKAEGKEEK